MGQIPEEVMVKQWYPDGQQPQTARPVIIPIDPSSDAELGQHVANDGGSYTAPIFVQLHCATQGASIAYQVDTRGKSDEAEEHWDLYTGPIRMTSGTTTIRTKAIRIGYQESDEQVALFAIS